MMWLFTIKTDGTLKARLVGRGDLMHPYVDFDPNAVYCGNVSACSIKMCISIAAKYKLLMRGGDLEGAYLVTRANKDYPVYIKTPQGYTIPAGYCIKAVGNLYGFPPAGQNFSIEFDKCVLECGYKNTPWDLKFFTNGLMVVSAFLSHTVMIFVGLALLRIYLNGIYLSQPLNNTITKSPMPQTRNLLASTLQLIPTLIIILIKHE